MLFCQQGLGAGVVRKETAQRGKAHRSVCHWEGGDRSQKAEREADISGENLTKEVKVHSGEKLTWKSSNRKTCMPQERGAYN